MNGNYGFKNNARKVWLILVGGIILSLLLSGCGAQPPKVYRVGILTSNPSFAAIGDGFKAKMTQLGYIENQNITYIVQNPSAEMADKQRLAKQLADDKVDLIFAYPALEAVAARAATQGTNTPVVFAYAQVEGTNLVKSVREPGGNMTGVRYPGPDLVSRRLEILHEIAPQVKRVWIGYDKNNANIPPTLEVLRLTASSLGITLVEVPATTAEELEADLAARSKSADLGLDAILAMPDSINSSPAGTAMLSKFAAEHKVPLTGGLVSQVQGALFVNGTNFTNVGELAAPLADKILKGTPAGSIPVVSPEQELHINYKVVQGLELTVPDGLLRQAVEIIR
jgi:putative tryptophan/tyrosine transport system substrate-binding protein